jgi:ABC-type sugar transport system substrate-binding protein
MNIRTCSLVLLIVVTLAGCAARPTVFPVSTPTEKVWTYKDMTVGFIQIGSEGGWLAANTVSFRETAEELGITLKFYDCMVCTQIDTFRIFIADEEINIIVLAARETTGYDEVLQEASDAGKIVVIEDRRIDAPKDLYATYVGSDFVEEGRKAGRAMVELLEDSQNKNVVELAGTVGTSAAEERGEGFHEAIEGSGVVITQSQTGNFTQTEGKAVMEAFLAQSRDIQGVFAQNDDMALGAIEAIKEAGLKPGVDIKIVSIDATSGAFEAMLAGELNVSVECNPLLAPQVYEAALRALNGEELPKWIPTIETVFYATDPNLAEIAKNRKY